LKLGRNGIGIESSAIREKNDFREFIGISGYSDPLKGPLNIQITKRTLEGR
jgi:hypothetical protein